MENARRGGVETPPSHFRILDAVSIRAPRPTRTVPRVFRAVPRSGGRGGSGPTLGREHRLPPPQGHADPHWHPLGLLPSALLPVEGEAAALNPSPHERQLVRAHPDRGGAGGGRGGHGGHLLGRLNGYEWSGRRETRAVGWLTSTIDNSRSRRSGSASCTTCSRKPSTGRTVTTTLLVKYLR